jgi:hypothetical protein
MIDLLSDKLQAQKSLERRPAWRCDDCKDIHFYCSICKECRTIPKEWEIPSVQTLKTRAEFSNTNYIICDKCWPVVKEKTIPLLGVKSKETLW